MSDVYDKMYDVLSSLCRLQFAGGDVTTDRICEKSSCSARCTEEQDASCYADSSTSSEDSGHDVGVLAAWHEQEEVQLNLLRQKVSTRRIEF